jgi:radical SAM superfamily enzyme YgiQ (UPF0313 family)
MKKIKILLGDPRHYTVGTHSQFVPIGIGYIGTFLKKEIEDVDIELKLEVEPEKLFSALVEWKPDVLGLSNYVWNAELSNILCEYAKKLNQNTLCILGGPEFPAGTGNRKIENTAKEPTYDKCLTYLISRPSVDYFAYTDGEVAFVEIVKKFIENKFSVKSMKKNDEPIKGSVSVSNNKNKLLVGGYIFRIGMQGSIKSEGRDIVPSPYLSGLLDKFLDGAFQPAFETSRGCPFLCTFCDQGIDESKITAFSTKRIADEIEYVGKRVSKIEKGIKTIYFFDSNWGLFQKDVDLADFISKVMEKYDWPKFIYATTPKSKRENIIKIDDKLKNRVGVNLPMQSMDTNVLKNIKRKNFELWQQVNHIKAIQKRGKTANTELIIPLPGETEKTYFEGFKFLMDNGVQTNTYTLMMLCGAELGRDEAIKKYGMKSKFRILPKEFGEYNGKKIFEIEQVCIGTNTMSFQSYLKCRNHSFVIKVLSQQIFSPIEILVKKFGISWFEITKEVSNIIQHEDFSGKFKEVYDTFCDESYTELFHSKEEAISFYSKPENYKSLMEGEIGENLSEKYVGKAILIYKDIITTIFHVIRNKLNNQESDLIINSAEKWLKNLYMIEEILDEETAPEKYTQSELKIDFDFPNWLLENHLPFDKFKNKCTYKMEYDVEKIKYFRNTKKSYDKNYNRVRAVGRFVRAHMSRGTSTYEKKFLNTSK